MRVFSAFLLALAALAGPWAAWAQTPALAPPEQTASAALTRDAPAPGRENQRVQFIHVEDEGNRVDEVRSGGETRRITVQPKNGAPTYQVQPVNAQSPLPPPAEAGPGASGPRTWKLLEF